MTEVPRHRYDYKGYLIVLNSKERKRLGKLIDMGRKRKKEEKLELAALREKQKQLREQVEEYYRQEEANKLLSWKNNTLELKPWEGEMKNHPVAQWYLDKPLSEIVALAKKSEMVFSESDSKEDMICRILQHPIESPGGPPDHTPNWWWD
jgi:hypothetical protein